MLPGIVKQGRVEPGSKRFVGSDTAEIPMQQKEGCEPLLTVKRNELIIRDIAVDEIEISERYPFIEIRV